jgi:hypothetical protein
MLARVRDAILIIFIFCMNQGSYSQGLELTQGFTQSLSKEVTVSIQFTYNESLLETVKEKSYWLNGGKETYETVFREMFTKYCKIQTSEKDTPHLFIVHVTNLDPGTSPEKNANRIAFLNCSVKLLDSNNLDLPLAVIELKDIRGKKSNFSGSFSYEGGSNFNASAGSRILESYAKAGKMLGAYISKNSGK